MKRFGLAFVITLSALFFPLELFAVGAFVYVVMFGGIEVILLAGLIDAYYGAYSFTPHFTITITVAVIAALCLRPYLWMYAQR